MDAEVLAWTIVFLGGDCLAVIILLTWAFRKDRQKMRAAGQAEEGPGQ